MVGLINAAPEDNNMGAIFTECFWDLLRISGGSSFLKVQRNVGCSATDSIAERKTDGISSAHSSCHAPTPEVFKKRLENRLSEMVEGSLLE